MKLLLHSQALLEPKSVVVLLARHPNSNEYCDDASDGLDPSCPLFAADICKEAEFFHGGEDRVCDG